MRRRVFFGGQFAFSAAGRARLALMLFVGGGQSELGVTEFLYNSMALRVGPREIAGPFGMIFPAGFSAFTWLGVCPWTISAMALRGMGSFCSR